MTKTFTDGKGGMKDARWLAGPLPGDVDASPEGRMYRMIVKKETAVGKRYDPAMHTAEHILNQTMVRMFDCGRCVSAHIEKKKSKCDYVFDRPLEESEATEIERRVNEVIEKGLPVEEHFVGRQEAAVRYDLDRLPDSAGDRIRIVTVGDYDYCPCIGPHVANTSAIGTFRITSYSWNEGRLRIRYKLSRP